MLAIAAAIGHDHIGENRRLPTERYSGLQEVRVYALDQLARLHYGGCREGVPPSCTRSVFDEHQSADGIGKRR